MIPPRIARANGILMPWMAYRAHKETGVPYYVLCAFLMQETGGGRNVYGHDVDASGVPRPFCGHGDVTQANYEAYKIERDLGIREIDRFPRLGRRSQGVGPMQLTYYAYQDKADELGGCWDPRVNVLVGAQIIAEYRTRGLSWHRVARVYNGKESYAVEMDARFDHWSDLLGGK